MTVTITGSSLSGVTNHESFELGYGQTYTRPSRGANTWYQNNTGKPIYIMGWRNSTGDSYMDIGPSTSSYYRLNNADADSSIIANPLYAIVPAGYYWRTQAGNNTNRDWVLS